MASRYKNGGQENRQEERTESEKSRPLFTRSMWTGAGTVDVSVWDKMVDGNDGQYRVFSVQAKRTWKDDSGYKSGNSFRPEDLLWLSLFLQEAAAFIASESSKR